MDEGYNFDNLNILKEQLEKEVSPEEILLHYFGDFDVPSKHMSPFRNEKNASFSIYYTIDGKLRWKDWGCIDKNSSGDPIGYVAKLEGINYYAAVNLIYDEMVKGKVRVPAEYVKKVKDGKNKPKVYSKGVRIRRYWKDYEVNYWDKLDASPKLMMKVFKTFPSDGVWFNNYRWHKSLLNDPLFIYLFNKAKESWKAYRPYSKDKDEKFKSNNINNHIQGFEDLPDSGNLVVITSAQKDRIPFYHAGIPSIAPHNENIVLRKSIMEDLKRRFIYVICAMNNDATGMKSNKTYSDLYNIPYWHVPFAFKDSTDPSDLYSNFGKNEFMRSIQDLIKLNRSPRLNVPY